MIRSLETALFLQSGRSGIINGSDAIQQSVIF
jgi:hypothetical protein